jgi:molybdate transport system substrate-binding protein
MLKLSRRTVMLGALAPAFPRLSWAQSDEIRVICSGGFTAAYNILAPRFEQITGKKVASAYGASMGNAPDAIPQRLARGEPTDIIILARTALDDFSARSVVRPDSRVDLAESRIGVAVRAGAPKPDISTVDALRRTLMGASSIAYSASASGVYISTELYKMGSRRRLSPRAAASSASVRRRWSPEARLKSASSRSARSSAYPVPSLSDPFPPRCSR